MASEAISEHLILEIFLGEYAPRRTIIGAPPVVSTFRCLCNWKNGRNYGGNYAIKIRQMYSFFDSYIFAVVIKLE